MFNRRSQLICVWSGPLVAVLFVVGGVVLGRFVPPMTRPGYSAQRVAQLYADHATRERLGAFVALMGMSLIAPFGVAIAAQTRRLEGRYPTLSYVQLTGATIGTMIGVLACLCWAVAAYRPLGRPAEFTRFANDVGYFMFVFPWGPFSVWLVAIGLSVLLPPKPVFPRYVGWLNVWVATLFVPAGLIVFFKHGVFDWAGLMALYMPLAVFFVWMGVMFYETRKNILAGDYEPAEPMPADT